MADVYIWSGATGAGTGADWANAFVNLSSISTKAAGDTFWVAHDHDQTQASALLITSPGTEASPCRICCVDRAGSVPPVAANLRTTAQVATTGASSITLAGTCSECYGVNFTAGDAANNAQIIVGNTANRMWKLSSCLLKLNHTFSGGRILVGAGAAASQVILDNVALQFGNTGHAIMSYARVFWRNTPNALVGPIFPNTLLMLNGSTAGSSWFVEGVDLSALGAGKTILGTAPNQTGIYSVLKDCKLGAGVIITAPPTTTSGNAEPLMIRSDSADTNYRTEKYAYAGTQTVETTIVRSGGASDGTTPISWKIVTTANPEYEYPFECLPIMLWNENVGSPKTLTIQGIWGTAALPKNDDIWIDVQYLGTSGFPLSMKATSSKGIFLNPNADVAAGSGTWGGSTTKFALATTFTPQKKGAITVYVRAAKPSSTFYVDPKAVLS